MLFFIWRQLLRYDWLIPTWLVSVKNVMTHAAFVSILSDCNQPLTSGSIYGLVIVRIELPIILHHDKSVILSSCCHTVKLLSYCQAAITCSIFIFSKAEERKYVSNVLKANGWMVFVKPFAFRTLETYFLSSAFERLRRGNKGCCKTLL